MNAEKFELIKDLSLAIQKRIEKNHSQKEVVLNG